MHLCVTINNECCCVWPNGHTCDIIMSKTSLYSIVLSDLPMKYFLLVMKLRREMWLFVVRDSMIHVMRLTCHMCHVLSHVMINGRYPYLHSQSVPDGASSGSGLHGKWIIGDWISAGLRVSCWDWERTFTFAFYSNWLHLNEMKMETKTMFCEQK